MILLENLGIWGVREEFGSGFLTECVGEPAYGAAARSNGCLSFKYAGSGLNMVVYYTIPLRKSRTLVLYRLSRTK